jgi:hypothetical protein
MIMEAVVEPMKARDEKPNSKTPPLPGGSNRRALPPTAKKEC